MAICVSHLHSSMRGSIAGITYLTTPAGAIIARQRVIPVNAPSNLRTFIKNALVEAVSDWDDIAPADKIAWQAWCTAHMPGISGRAAMVGAKSFLLYASSACATAPVIVAYDKRPDFVNPPSITVTVSPLALPGTGFDLKVTNTSPVALYGIYEVSQPFGNGRNYWKGPWTPGATDGFALAIGANVVKPIIVGNAGDVAFVRVRCCTNDNTALKKGHVLTAPSIIKGTVATTV